MFTLTELKSIASALPQEGRAVFIVKREIDRLVWLENHEQHIWNTYCRRYGLKPSDRNKVFRVGANQYKAVALNIRSVKNPIACERTTDGRRFNMPVVRNLM